MKSGRLYRHPRCLDIDLFICSRVGANRYRVRYWNRHWKMFQAELETVTIIDPIQWKEVV
jgi:hypothetical protein